MAQRQPALNALTNLEWAAYVRFMREEMQTVSPEAAELLRQAEETLVREADAGENIYLMPARPGIGH